jgi:hypothetical protein
MNVIESMSSSSCLSSTVCGSTVECVREAIRGYSDPSEDWEEYEDSYLVGNDVRRVVSHHPYQAEQAMH